MDEAALILARFYMSPPASPGWTGFFETALEPETGSDSTFSLLPTDILVNSDNLIIRAEFNLTVFRRFFSKNKAALTGAPPIRRMKTYSAQSGYVYQYFYEGHRPYSSRDDRGIEFAFSISSDRKTWRESSVLLSDPAIHDWEQTHARALSLTERYAVAKIALFQAFDERAEPSQMDNEVRVRAADVEGIVETLGL